MKCSASRVWVGMLGMMVVASALSRSAQAQDLPSRQVTLFGIIATPNSKEIDPELKTIAPQLRQYLPDHGFKLLEVQSKRLLVGQTLSCRKLNGYQADATLMDPLDVNGKVQLRFALGASGQMEASTIVATPPNQPFFINKPLSDGSRLLIGMGAR